MEKQKLQRIEELVRVTSRGDIVVFVDECMFTSRSILDRTWRTSSMGDLFTKQKISFKAIGVLAAIDTHGTPICLITKDGSIGLPEMMELTAKLK